MGIKDRQAVRRDEHAQVLADADDGIGDAIVDWDGVNARRAAASLGDVADDCAGQNHDEHGNLFNDQPDQLSNAIEAAQWPDVQQQQGERQGDEHRFGHQSKHQSEQRERVKQPSRATATAAPGIRGIRHRCQQPENRAQHILSLRYPCDRLNAQRMHGE